MMALNTSSDGNETRGFKGKPVLVNAENGASQAPGNNGDVICEESTDGKTAGTNTTPNKRTDVTPSGGGSSGSKATGFIFGAKATNGTNTGPNKQTDVTTGGGGSCGCKATGFIFDPSNGKTVVNPNSPLKIPTVQGEDQGPCRIYEIPAQLDEAFAIMHSANGTLADGNPLNPRSSAGTIYHQTVQSYIELFLFTVGGTFENHLIYHCLLRGYEWYKQKLSAIAPVPTGDGDEDDDLRAAKEEEEVFGIP
jgi:hypothetical protein